MKDAQRGWTPGCNCPGGSWAALVGFGAWSLSGSTATASACRSRTARAEEAARLRAAASIAEARLLPCCACGRRPHGPVRVYTSRAGAPSQRQRREGARGAGGVCAGLCGYGDDACSASMSCETTAAGSCCTGDVMWLAESIRGSRQCLGCTGGVRLRAGTATSHEGFALGIHEWCGS